MTRKTRYTFPTHELTRINPFPGDPRARNLYRPTVESDLADNLLNDFQRSNPRYCGSELRQAKAVQYSILADRFRRAALYDLSLHALLAARLHCNGTPESPSGLAPYLRQEYRDAFDRMSTTTNGLGRARKTVVAHRQGKIVLATQNGFIRVDGEGSVAARDLLPCRIP